jgi:hypothetical protein
MITIIDRLRGIAKAIPPCNNGTSEGGYAYEAEVMLRAADELAAMQARAERAEGLLAGRKTYWPHDADGDQGSDDLDAICDGYEIGDTFSVQVALMLPDEYYVMQVNDKGQSDPLPATPEEIEALKAERRAENARRKAEFDRINAERFKPVKAVPIDTARSEARLENP